MSVYIITIISFLFEDVSYNYDPPPVVDVVIVKNILHCRKTNHKSLYAERCQNLHVA